MTFQVFAKENCRLCRKAREILARLPVETEVRYVDGPDATPENVADFAWHDWVDKMPLVVAFDGDRVLERWDGSRIERRWLPEIRGWLAAHTVSA